MKPWQQWSSTTAKTQRNELFAQRITGTGTDSPNELEPIPTIYKNRQLKKTE